MALLALPVLIVVGFVATSRIDPGGIDIDAEWTLGSRGLITGYRATVVNHTDAATQADCTVDALAPASNDLVLASDEFLTVALEPGRSTTHEGRLHIAEDLGQQVAVRDLPSATCQVFPS